VSRKGPLVIFGALRNSARRIESPACGAGNRGVQGACGCVAHVLLWTERNGSVFDLEAATVLTLCSQCDKPESQCSCEKFCCFCQSQYNIRLAVDGMYYCPDCREACDVRVADAEQH